MKTNLFACLLMVFTTLVSAQEQGNITGRFYITNVDIVVEEIDITAEPNDETKHIANYDSKYIAIAGTKFTA